MLYVATRSTGEGRNAGIASALGITVGCLVHTFALAIGLSALLAAVPLAYDLVRYGGLPTSSTAELTPSRCSDGATRLPQADAYKDISTYNFNGIDYAFVRSEVVNRKPAM